MGFEIPDPRIISFDTACLALEQLLRERLADVVRRAGWDDDLDEIATWRQVPTLKSIDRAPLPAVSITTGGTVGPIENVHGCVSATFRVLAGVWDRGRSYEDTASRARRWGAAVHVAVLEDPTLGGLAEWSRCVSMRADEFPNTDVARTLGGAEVGFDVRVTDIFNLPPGGGGSPVFVEDVVTDLHVTTAPHPAISTEE